MYTIYFFCNSVQQDGCTKRDYPTWEAADKAAQPLLDEYASMFPRTLWERVIVPNK